jgi:hypothetical protein
MMTYIFLNPTNGKTREVLGPVGLSLAATKAKADGLLPAPWMLLKIVDDTGAILWLADAAIG